MMRLARGSLDPPECGDFFVGCAMILRAGVLRLDPSDEPSMHWLTFITGSMIMRV